MISWGQLCKPLNVSGLLNQATIPNTIAETSGGIRQRLVFECAKGQSNLLRPTFRFAVYTLVSYYDSFCGSHFKGVSSEQQFKPNF